MRAPPPHLAAIACASALALDAGMASDTAFQLIWGGQLAALSARAHAVSGIRTLSRTVAAAELVEVEGSHCGMGLDPAAYRPLASALGRYAEG